MEFGIRGKRALVCGASKGLGRACAFALAHEGVDIALVARSPDQLQATAAALRAETGVAVTAIVADVTSEEGQRITLAACPAPDILVTNAGGPPAGDFRQFDRADWLKATEANMISAIALITATIDTMIERGFGRIVNITSSAVRVPNPILSLSTAARAGLTAFSAGIAPDLAKYNVTINNLLPGPFDTDRLAETIRASAKRHGRDEATERELRIKSYPAGRPGRPEELGATCAFLCSAHAAYLTGQNIMLAGGLYPTTM